MDLRLAWATWRKTLSLRKKKVLALNIFTTCKDSGFAYREFIFRASSSLGSWAPVK